MQSNALVSNPNKSCPSLRIATEIKLINIITDISTDLTGRTDFEHAQCDAYVDGVQDLWPKLVPAIVARIQNDEKTSVYF